MYKKVESNLDAAQLEKNVLKFWQQNKTFEQSVNNRSKNNQFVFFDGPPFANGLPHYGHLLTGFIKDSVARYQTQRGKRVERRFGWDCHGLPAEMAAEKELNISGRIAIKEFGIDKFNQTCKNSVMKYTSEWQEYVTRQARWVDFENDYKTMDKNFMESVLWAFKELYKKGLVYQAMKVMPYSWACETLVSNFETRLDNSYRERADKAATILFKIKNYHIDNLYAAAWTTTPWTLPSNLALAVGADIDYAIIETKDKNLIIAKSSLAKYQKELGEEPTIIEIIKGEMLANLEYVPLFNYFANHPNAFRILVADFVEEGDGTGIVHIAPGFGEDDQILCEKYNIELVCPVDNGGCFTSPVDDLLGKQVLSTNDEIIIKIKHQGQWLRTEQYIHNYPHCWRTDQPLIYKAVPSWYVKVSAFKDRMVELNQQINWIPNHIQNGLFGKWLENAKDWAISRNRFWGTPLPIWVSDNPQYPRVDVYGSIAELEQDFGVEIKDLHRPYIDELTRPNPDDPSGKTIMRRVEDVFDCWFESGSMPYGQIHYPFENKEIFENNFPADFIVEYTAQTRGWFYTLMVLSTALFDRPPFKNCICHGVILDEKGQKLSKRLNNYANPLDIFDKYGSDSLRFVMLSSPIMRGAELLIDKEGKMVKDAQRLTIKPLWNAYYFFNLYANIDKHPGKEITESDNKLDNYILSKLALLNQETIKQLDSFDTISATEGLNKFIDVLNNWYIRLNRQRFWQAGLNKDKEYGYNTLYTVLLNLTKLYASILPLTMEEIYQNLTGNNFQNPAQSVHLELLPDLSNITINYQLIDDMDKVAAICNAAHSIRNHLTIRIRQPLNKLMIIGADANFKGYENIILEETNVKKIEYISDIKEHADFKLKLNFPIFGKRIPTYVKDVTKAMKENNYQIIDQQLHIAGQILIENEFSLNLESHDKNNSSVIKEYNLLVKLDTEINEDLYQEGIARDIIRSIQQLRKDQDFNVQDRLNLSVYANNAKLKAVIENYSQYISEQTLTNLSLSDIENHGTWGEIEENKIQIMLSK